MQLAHVGLEAIASLQHFEFCFSDKDWVIISGLKKTKPAEIWIVVVSLHLLDFPVS